jgi:hypothetical protein
VALPQSTNMARTHIPTNSTSRIRQKQRPTYRPSTMPGLGTQNHHRLHQRRQQHKLLHTTEFLSLNPRTISSTMLKNDHTKDQTAGTPIQPF